MRMVPAPAATRCARSTSRSSTRPGVAFRYRDKGMPEKLFAGKSARLVVPMGMPAFFYRWVYRAHGVKGLERNILRFVGMGPVRTTLVGMAGGREGSARSRWLEHLRVLGKAAS